jgi:hypothetical protein
MHVSDGAIRGHMRFRAPLIFCTGRELELGIATMLFGKRRPLLCVEY